MDLEDHRKGHKNSKRQSSASEISTYDKHGDLRPAGEHIVGIVKRGDGWESRSCCA